MKKNLSKLLVFFLILFSTASKAQDAMVRISGGEYAPFFENQQGNVVVEPFLLDEKPVTNAQFEHFIRENPQWKRSNVRRIFANKNYLMHWQTDSTHGPGLPADAPATYVSWFAAKAYAAWLGKRLPTIDEWEFVARASPTSTDARRDSLFNRSILRWYETPETYKRPVGKAQPNFWGVHDMFGLVWEWTADYNSVLITGESRNDTDTNDNLFCGGGSVGAQDLMNYAAFMRFAFRGSLKPQFAIKNLGFRCARDLP